MPAFSGCRIYVCLDPSNTGIKPESAEAWIRGGGGTVTENPADASHVLLQHLGQEQAAALAGAGFSDKFCSLTWFFACLEAQEPMVSAAHPLYCPFPSRAIEGAAQLGEVCQSGFSATWRHMFASLLISMGVKFSKELRFVLDGGVNSSERQTALLVCHDVTSNSAKAEAARNYGIPIINMQWILDCLEQWALLPTASYTADAPVTLVHFLPSPPPLPAVTQGMVAESEDDEADVDPAAPLMPQSIRSAVTAPAAGTASTVPTAATAAAAGATEQQQQGEEKGELEAEKGKEEQQQNQAAAAIMPQSAPVNPAQQLRQPAVPPGTVVGSGGDGGKKAGKPTWRGSGVGSAVQSKTEEEEKQQEEARSQSPPLQHKKQQASETEMFYRADTKKQQSSTGGGAEEGQRKKQRPGTTETVVPPSNAAAAAANGEDAPDADAPQRNISAAAQRPSSGLGRRPGSAAGGGNSNSSMMAGLLGVNGLGATQAMANVGNLAKALMGATEAQERDEPRPLPLPLPAAAAEEERKDATPTPSDLSLDSAHRGLKEVLIEPEEMAVDGPEAPIEEEAPPVQSPLPAATTEVIEVEGEDDGEGGKEAESEVKRSEEAAAAEPPVVSRAAGRRPVAAARQRQRQPAALAADFEGALVVEEAAEARGENKGAKRSFLGGKKSAAAVVEEEEEEAEAAAPPPPPKPLAAKKAPAAVKKKEGKAPAAARKTQPSYKRSAAAAVEEESGTSELAKKRRRGAAAPVDHQPACHIAFSGMHTVEQQALVAKLQPLGVRVTAGKHEWNDSYTHVVAPSVRRNAKCLAALAAGSWLVGPGFAAACRSAGKIVDAEPHELDVGDAGVVAPGVAQCWRERRASTGGGAFSGLTFAVAQKIDEPPTRGELLSILKAGGATVVSMSSQEKMADVVVVAAAAAATKPSVQQRINQGAMAVTPKWIVEFLALPQASLKAHRLAGTAPNARVAAAEAGRAPGPESSVSL